ILKNKRAPFAAAGKSLTFKATGRSTKCTSTLTMRNDEIIRSIRYLLNIDDVKIAHILKLRDYKPRRGEIEAIFETEDVPELEYPDDASDELMAYFLDGLIYYKRGKSKDHPPRPIKTPVTNNLVLKKLRVAYKLKEKDMHEILDSAGFSL